jgi:hypothetical protein
MNKTICIRYSDVGGEDKVDFLTDKEPLKKGDRVKFISVNGPKVRIRMYPEDWFKKDRWASGQPAAIVTRTMTEAQPGQYWCGGVEEVEVNGKKTTKPWGMEGFNVPELRLMKLNEELQLPPTVSNPKRRPKTVYETALKNAKRVLRNPKVIKKAGLPALNIKKMKELAELVQKIETELTLGHTQVPPWNP